MNKIVKDKSILVGDEKLVKKNKWIPLTDMDTDLKILNHKLFQNSFNKIVREHKPKHNIAFISLCTSTRPYHLGRKWKKFKEDFDGKADLIVISSGGVIPEEYWDSYPYLNYDGDSSKKANKLYAEKLTQRLTKFLKTHSYEYVIANFRPNLRNTPTVQKVLKKLKHKGIISNYQIIPDQELYEDAQLRGFPGGKVFPDLDVKILEKLNTEVDKLL